MKLNAITYTEHETEGSVPSAITVTLTARELVYIARMTGSQPATEANLILDSGHIESNAVYRCLNGVANSHFDGGLDDWAQVVER
jgi:hypothetical protein